MEAQLNVEVDEDFDTDQFLTSYEQQWDSGLVFAEQVDFLTRELYYLISSTSLLPSHLLNPPPSPDKDDNLVWDIATLNVNTVGKFNSD